MTSENNGMYMPVAPAYGYGGYGNGGGIFGGNGDIWGILLILLLCGNGMWGGFGGFGGGMMWPMMMGGMGAGMGIDYLYPWLNNSDHINSGFRDQQIQTTLGSIQNGLTTGFGNVQLGQAGINQNICQTGNGIVAAITGAQNAVSQQLYSNEIASLNRSFAEQTANAQGFNSLQSGLCDARYASATNTRDIIDNQNRTSQAIMDKLCALELDGVKNQLAQAQRENTGLQNQLNMANLAASQATQTTNIRDSIISELRSCPIPAQPVYGSQPIFTCGGNNNVGCGCNGGFMN